MIKELLLSSFLFFPTIATADEYSDVVNNPDTKVYEMYDFTKPTTEIVYDAELVKTEDGASYYVYISCDAKERFCTSFEVEKGRVFFVRIR